MVTSKRMVAVVGAPGLLVGFGGMLLCGLLGCGPRLPSPHMQMSLQAETGQPQVADVDTRMAGSFDFYLLNLSWSPEFCATHAGGLECAEHRGFIVHGLWPQRTDGSYPEQCTRRPGPTDPHAWADIMPDAGLVQHEWQTHGTCTPYAADTYFSMVRRAYRSVTIPAEFASMSQEQRLAPAAIVDAFTQANPGFPAGSIAISCGNNRLTAVEVCLTQDLRPEACSGIRSCRANAVKVTPLQ